MEKDTTRKDPLMEGLRAAVKPLAGGLIKGSFWGAVIGVITATGFALASFATTGTPAGLYAAGTTLGIMGGFTTYPVQMFFNAIINAGVRGVQSGREAFMSGYHEAKSYNELLDVMEGKSNGVAVAKGHQMQVATHAPQPSKGIQEILERGPAESHHDAAKRMADILVDGHAAR